MPNQSTKLFITGSEVIAKAAIDAGCNFFAGYPITPASGVLKSMLQMLPGVHGVGIQGEDEITSIGFCLGASAAGMKVLTATSGPGISLYSENIGFGMMAEIPMVIVNVQRMGPATGGATTNAEGDIMFMRWVTSGGYPMIVLVPTTLEEAYTLTVEAFNLAESLRTVVILATNKDLAMSNDTLDPATLHMPPLVERKQANPGTEKYLPYFYDKLSDIPDFAALGGSILSRFNTSTHGKNGHLVKKPAIVNDSLMHLVDKIYANQDKIDRVDADIDEGAETIIVAYGQPARSARDTIDHARANGRKLSLLTVYSVWPVPEKKLLQYVAGHKRIVLPEHNLGQYAIEIERLFPDKEVRRINRIDGKQITPDQIEERCF